MIFLKKTKIAAKISVQSFSGVGHDIYHFFVKLITKIFVIKILIF